jgi:hypothetical protein
MSNDAALAMTTTAAVPQVSAKAFLEFSFIVDFSCLDVARSTAVGSPQRL